MSIPVGEKQLKSSQNFNDELESLKLYKECHDFAFRAWSPFLQEARKDLAVYLGDQWDHQDRMNLKEQKRNALVFNRVRRNIKMITGYERRTRHSIIAEPVENSDELTANQLTAAMLWVMNREDMANTMSDAFEGALKTGINFVQLGIDYTSDPVNGDFVLERIPYNQILADPRFTKRNLKDCEFLIQRRLLSKEGVKMLIPFRADDIERIEAKGADGRFPNMQPFFSSRNKGALKYDEFWRRTSKNVKMLVDQESGDMREFNTRDLDKEKLNFFLQQFPNIKVVNKQKPSVELTIIVEGHVMFKGEDPWKIGDFPHVPVMAFWDPEHSSNNSHFHDGTPGRDDLGDFFSNNHSGDFALKLQSLVRCIRDPQTEANKRRSKMLDIIDSQINSGWQAKASAVVNKKDLYNSGQGKVVWMADDAQMTDAIKIPPADIPPGLFQLSTQMDNDIVEIAGITDELLGMQDDGNLQMSGVLAKLRQGAGLTVLQDLFDNFRLSQKLFGQKLVNMIQNNWGPQKLQRVINEEPSPQFISGNFSKHDIVVEEAVETSSQRALAYAQLMQAVQAGILPIDAVRDQLIDLSPIQDKAKVKEAMAQQAQAAQSVQQQQIEDQVRLRELQRAKVFSDLGLGVERLARAEADRGLARERISELQENQANAVLERFKAIKEIQNMDDEQVMRTLGLIQSLEEGQKKQAEGLQAVQGEKSEDQFLNALGFVRDQSAQQPGIQIQPQDNLGV